MKDRQTRLILWCIIALLMALSESQGVNSVYDPCRPPPTIRVGDGFSFALAFGGTPDTWNNTVPCNTTAIEALPAGSLSLARILLLERRTLEESLSLLLV